MTPSGGTPKGHLQGLRELLTGLTVQRSLSPSGARLVQETPGTNCASFLPFCIVDESLGPPRPNQISRVDSYFRERSTGTRSTDGNSPVLLEREAKVEAPLELLGSLYKYSEPGQGKRGNEKQIAVGNIVASQARLVLVQNAGATVDGAIDGSIPVVWCIIISTGLRENEGKNPELGHPKG